MLPFACFVEWLLGQNVADTGDVFMDAFGTDPTMEEDPLEGSLDRPGVPRKEKPNASTEEKTVGESLAHTVDRILSAMLPKCYDFALQFEAYVLADKLQAPVSTMRRLGNKSK